MPRERIGMSDTEVRAYLADERWMVLGTLDPDGSPWADAVRVRFEGERLLLRVPHASRSFANIGRDPRVCAASDRFASYYEIRGVTVHGRAEAVEGEAAADRDDWERGGGAPPGGDPGDAPGEKSAVFALPLDDVFSFDFAKIERKT